MRYNGFIRKNTGYEVKIMYKFPIGIILDSFRKPFPEAVGGVRGQGVLNPEENPLLFVRS